MILVKENLCDFCGTCVSVCAVDAIELFESSIHIIEDRCTDCLKCIKVCPLNVLEKGENEK